MTTSSTSSKSAKPSLTSSATVEVAAIKEEGGLSKDLAEELKALRSGESKVQTMLGNMKRMLATLHAAKNGEGASNKCFD